VSARVAPIPGSVGAPLTRGSAAPAPVAPLPQAAKDHRHSHGGLQGCGHSAQNGYGPATRSVRVRGHLAAHALWPVVLRCSATLLHFQLPCRPGAGRPALVPARHSALSSSAYRGLLVRQRVIRLALLMTLPEKGLLSQPTLTGIIGRHRPADRRAAPAGGDARSPPHGPGGASPRVPGTRHRGSIGGNRVS